jgi:hypothetical protein
MKTWPIPILACVVTIFASSSVALAHKPTFGDQGYDSPEAAYVVDDPSVSIVFYRSVTCKQPQLWMTFEASAGFSLFVQLLVPRIERLLEYRPAVAVVGPGLPAVDPGIRLPAGSGAIVFRTEGVQPRPFDESFTMTQDLILVEQTITLPASGRYYIVAWDPAGRTGKLDLAVGTVEQFGIADIAMAADWTRLTRTFHETPDYPPAGDVKDEVCDRGSNAPAADEDAGTAVTSPDASQSLDDDAGSSPSLPGEAPIGMAPPSRDGGAQPMDRGGLPSGAGSPAIEAPQATLSDAAMPPDQPDSSAPKNEAASKNEAPTPKLKSSGCSVSRAGGQNQMPIWFALGSLAFLRLRRRSRSW